MEHTLRCNSIKCRKELADRALVTTCSHIFCPDCATRLGLAGQRHEHGNSCPACGTHLANPDDAVVTNLKPTEDYKTSVLSGLSPNIIIECASRALSFWAYQTTQEIIYQEYLVKSFTDKYSNLNLQLDRVINDANAEITSLHTKLGNMKVDQDTLQKKNEELSRAYNEKNRKLLQTQELYDKLKRKAMLGQIQDAAEDAVDSTLHNSFANAPSMRDSFQENSALGDHGVSYDQHHPTLYDQQSVTAAYQPHATLQTHTNSWPRTMGAQLDIPITPSTHRQRVGDPVGLGLSTIPGLVVGTPRSPRNQMNSRVPLGDISSNNLRSSVRFPAVGLSSGLKIGQDGKNMGDLITSARPRVAQRPTPQAMRFNKRHIGNEQEIISSGMRPGFSR
ncbi:hypothetical protein F4809DRAFT_613379 [Biscogniauxia mediterranea]|nr:hypothetical protein F4809DRAFT_613379 [Biscogniauxia mediterranea]